MDVLNALVQEGEHEGGNPRPHSVGDAVPPPHKQVGVQVELEAAQVSKTKGKEELVPFPVDLLPALNHLLCKHIRS